MFSYVGTFRHSTEPIGFGNLYSSSKLLLDAACMMTQFVPSDTNVAQFPTTFNKIAVPAVVLSIGTMLDDAELTA